MAIPKSLAPFIGRNSPHQMVEHEAAFRISRLLGSLQTEP